MAYSEVRRVAKRLVRKSENWLTIKITLGSEKNIHETLLFVTKNFEILRMDQKFPRPISRLKEIKKFDMEIRGQICNNSYTYFTIF